MIARLRGRRVLQAIALGAMVGAAFAPVALAFYRCHSMGRMAAPCCGGHEDRSRGSETAQVRAGPCCTKVTVAVERAASELNPDADARPSPLLVAGLVDPVRADPSQVAPSPAWTHVRFDAGPPILLRVCSLLL